jgi:CHAT domain-containing protein
VQQIYVALRMVDLVWGDEAAVAEWLDQAAAIAAGLTLPHLDYRIDARLGRLRLAQRQYDEAERALGRAIDRVETVRGTVAQEALRTSFLHDKASIYADLLRLYLERNQPGDLARAFEIVERSRARVLVDLLQGLVQSHLTLNDEEAQALAEIQSDLDALYNRLLEGDEGGAQRGSAPAALHLLEKSIRHLHLRAAARVGGRENDPVAAVAEEAQHGAQFDLAALRATLGSQGYFVSFFELDNEFGAFVIDADDLHVVRGLGSVSVVQSWVERLAVQWERFRIDRRFIESHLGQLERSTRRILGELYRLLWLPLTPYLRRMAPCPVTLIPHGVLHQIPFHALHDGETYLLQQHIFTYAPNATVHLLCQKRQPPGWGDTLVLGTTDARTPLMQVEAERVAVLLPGATCLVGKDASLAALDDLLRSGRGYDLVHLACHGLFRADNPIYSALKLEDGWLKAVDLLGFPLDGALVVLSACESGRSRVVPGNELLGLPRAVLGAGARTAVVSQWIVQDDAAAQCMELFYQARGVGADTASALRQAQIRLAATRPHPYYWAAFMAMGAA